MVSRLQLLRRTPTLGGTARLVLRVSTRWGVRQTDAAVVAKAVETLTMEGRLNLDRALFVVVAAARTPAMPPVVQATASCCMIGGCKLKSPARVVKLSNVVWGPQGVVLERHTVVTVSWRGSHTHKTTLLQVAVGTMKVK